MTGFFEIRGKGFLQLDEQENETMENDPPCIRIVDDESSVCRVLAALVHSIGFTSRIYESAELLISNDCLTDPGCVLVDLGLKGISGKDLVTWISQQPLKLPVVVISGQGSIQLAVQCLKEGASDYLEKPFDTVKLITVVREVVAQDAVDRITNKQRMEIQKRYSTLSQRERQVLSCLADGLINKQIAVQLGLSSKTVEHHRAHVMQKMQMSTLAEVVKAYGSLGQS